MSLKKVLIISPSRFRARLLAPTEKSKQILLGEGVSEDKIFVTGNTVVDAVYQNLEVSKKKGGVSNHFGLDVPDYFWSRSTGKRTLMKRRDSAGF